MGIGLSGMISGLDTDSIVKAMVSGQQTKATKIENKITLNKWTTEAWSGLNKKIYSFYTKYASKLRLQSSYMTRTATSTNEGKVKATATSSAAVGTHTLQINALASSQYVTGAKLGAKDTYSKNTKLKDLGGENAGVKEGTIITITGKAGSGDDKIQKLEVTADTTVNDFLNACKEAGLTASFDSSQQRFFISSSESGADDKFTITTSALSADAAAGFEEIAEKIDLSALSSAEKTDYENAMATLRQNTGVIDTVLGADYDASDKTQKAVSDAINVVKNAAEKTNAYERATASVTQSVEQSLKTAAENIANGTDTEGKFTLYEKEYKYADLFASAKERLDKQAATKADKAGDEAIKAKIEELSLDFSDKDTYVDPTTLTEESVQKAVEDAAEAYTKFTDAGYDDIAKLDEAVAAGTLTQEEADKLETATKMTATWDYKVGTDADGNDITIGSIYAEAHQASMDADPVTDEKIAEELKSTFMVNIKTNFDKEVAEVQNEILELEDSAEVTSLKEGIENTLKAAAAAGTTTSSGLSAMGLGEIDGSAKSDGGTNGMAVVAASNAEFVLDGATMTETSNNFTVNGLTLNLSGTTLNEDTGKHEEVKITVGKDTESTYNLVKEAITEYNKLIEEMNELYNAKSSRGYDPLTDEQKEAMSETDIENWEKKIKDSLLRRDNTLGTLLTSMRTSLTTTYKDEKTGKSYALSSFGIVTGNYTENGKLHIYGDEDDATYATYTDKLKAALEDDPELVMETLTEVFGNLYETMTEKCSKTEIRSALTFYNDKQYTNLLGDYEDDLDIMEERIKELEDKYYKQFTAMETAMSKLQSQSSSLASLLGMNTQQ